MEILELLMTNYAVASIAVILAVIFSLICSANVKMTFSKYNKTRTANGMTGYDAARQILDANGLQGVQITRVAGDLTDHFDPRTNTVALSDTVYSSANIGAVGVAAHECGHAIQYARNYAPIKIRNTIFPAVNICQKTWMWLFLIGIGISSLGYLSTVFINIGIVFFAVVVVFQLITLPVEFNASGRAINTLNGMGILQGRELSGAKKVLRAAAMTYVASLLVSLMQLFRLIASTNRRR